MAAGFCERIGSSRPESNRQPEECAEPRNRLVGREEEERPDRRDQGPQAHGTRGEVTAERPLEQEWQQRHHRHLAEPEEAVALGPSEHHEASHRCDLVDEWDRRGPRQTQQPIRADPDDGQTRDAGGREGQRGLLRARLVRIAPSDPDRGEPADIPGKRRCEPHYLRVCTAAKGISGVFIMRIRLQASVTRTGVRRSPASQMSTSEGGRL